MEMDLVDLSDMVNENESDVSILKEKALNSLTISLNRNAFERYGHALASEILSSSSQLDTFIDSEIGLLETYSRLFLADANKRPRKTTKATTTKKGTGGWAAGTGYGGVNSRGYMPHTATVRDFVSLSLTHSQHLIIEYFFQWTLTTTYRKR